MSPVSYELLCMDENDNGASFVPLQTVQKLTFVWPHYRAHDTLAILLTHLSFARTNSWHADKNGQIYP